MKLNKLMLLCILGFFFSKVDSQTVTATQVDSLVGDHQTQGVANPKDTVRYKTKISVTGANATGVNFNNLIPNNTTMVGTVKTSALCRDDVFATSFNTMLNMGNVLSNDFGLPSVSVVSFGTTMSGGTTTAAGNAGTTNGGGTLTLNADGTFSYQPMMGFSGVDQFAYIGTTGVAGLQNGSAIVTINVAADITFTTVDVQPTCNGGTTGSITFSASGGSGALMYSITGPMGTFQVSPVFSGLSAGTYNLAVKDAVNYTKTGSTTLTDPPLLSFTTMEVNNPCNGVSVGGISFSATGGTGSLMYSITGAMGTYQVGSTFSGLAANTYNLAVKDANNCIATGMATITEPAPIGFTFSKTDISCNGAGDGSIVFTSVMGGTSPYTYSINGVMGTFTGNTTYTNLAANTYNLVVKDNMGCNSAAQAAAVIEPAAIVVSGTIPTLTYNVTMANAAFTKTGGSGSPAAPWSGSGFPSGVSINTSTGVVSGTPTQTGMFTATVTYTDANGCTDDIMVSFNVAPRLLANTYAVVGNTQLVSNGHSAPATPHTTDATNILTNDESDAAITITAGTFSTVNMGSITIGSDGKFIYTPPAGSMAADSYTYTGTSNGVSATATITFNITNMVWYVNNTFGGTPDGRSNTPFTTCNAAATASAVNQIIYVHTGTGNTTGNTVLKSGQTLRGAGNALTLGALTIPAGTKPTLSGTVTLANSVNVDGFDMSTGSSTAIASSGATSVSVSIGNVTTSGAANAINLVTTTGTVIIAGGTLTGGAGAPVNINGGTVSLTYSGSASQATALQPLINISGGHSGTVTFNTGTLSATDGSGLQFNDADGTYNVNGTCTLNGGDAGVDIINGSSGSFTFSNTSITNPIGTAFNANSCTFVNINCNGSIAKNSSGRLIDISSNTGGTITFNNTLSSTGTSTGILVNSNSSFTVNFAGTTKTISTGANTAVSITSNSGTTSNFINGGLDITVTSGTGFNATGGGTINVTGSNNTIVSTTGIALNVSNTTIGSNNLNFTSISSNGSVNGIVLNNTGTSGGLNITGAATLGSGGTIQNTTSHGISLNQTINPSFNRMIITNTTRSGIKGNLVTNFTFTNGSITYSGVNFVTTAVGMQSDGNITFNEGSFGTPTTNEQSLTGTVIITGNTLNYGLYCGVEIYNYQGNLSNINISNNSFTSPTQSSVNTFDSAIKLVASGNSSHTASITKASILNNTITGFPANAGIFVSHNNASSGAPGTTMGIPNDPNNLIDISNNLISGFSGTNKMGTQAILFAINGTSSGSRSQGNVRVNNNGTIGNPLSNIIGTAIAVSAFGYSTVTAEINNNIINPNNTVGSQGIGGGTGVAGGSGSPFNLQNPDLTITANNNVITNTDGNGILLVARDCSGILKATIRNNNVAAPLGGVRPGIRIDAGNAGSVDDQVCLDITNNTSAGSGGTNGIGLRKQGTGSTVNDFGVEGMSATSSPGVEAYISGNNPAGNGVLLISATSGFTNCSTAP